MKADTQGLHLAFRPDLQGLRAIAILLVIAAHAGMTFLQGGFVGVDVFFVLSGYLISGLLFRELHRSSRISFSRFYARRLKRLLPALIVMICVVFALALWLLSSVEARAQLISSPYAATWTSNLFFAFSQAGYFDELAAKDLFVHTWSLGVEEQFYLFWPLLFSMLFMLGRKKWTPGNVDLHFFVFPLSVILILSLCLSLYLTWSHPQQAFYQMPSRIWQFSLGALVFLYFENHGARGRVDGEPGNPWQAALMLPLGLLLIAGSALGLSEHVPYPGYWAIFPSLGAALVIASGCQASSRHLNVLGHPMLVWIGDRSYSLYLWHWPVLILGASLGLQHKISASMGLVLFTFLAAIVSYRLVELPFWKGRFSHVRPRMILAFGVLVMVIAVALLTYGLNRLPKTSVTSDMSNRWRFDLPVVYSMDCDSWFRDDKVQACLFGPKDAKKTVVMLGDSVALQWFSFVPKIFSQPEWRVVVLTKSSCPMVDEDYFYPRIGKVFELCNSWRNKVLSALVPLHPDVVVVGNAATYDFSDEAWVDGSKRVMEKLSKAAKKVYVIPGTPTLGFDGPGCVARHMSANGFLDKSACAATDRMKRPSEITTILKQATSGLGNVQVIDLNTIVCPHGQCNAASEDGLVVFRDSQHLTDTFVKARVPQIRELIH